MADVICRWRNATPKTVVELVNALPHKELTSLSFRDYMINSIYGENFFRTPYQLACQLGLYYDDGTTYHPRFNYDINEDEAIIYLQRWIHRYYVPNPYTKSLKTLESPILLVESIVKNIEEKGNRNLKDILEELFKDDMGNLDIIQNLLNNYSNVISTDSNGQVSLKENYKEYMEKVINKNDKKAFFHAFDENKRTKTFEGSLQQIFYGAPGTGKSHKIKELADERGESVVRTTFHPDSDYSTFVGSYKPTMGRSYEEILSSAELKVRLFEIKTKGETYPCHKFATQYWFSLSKLQATDIKEILKECGFTESMYQEVNKGIAVGKEMSELKEDRIVYKFVAQAFLQAYVQAWQYYADAAENEPKKQFLVIEEINRGNCAQIFGDLFQLLDRNEYGFSEYYINADTDLKAYLARAFDGMSIEKKEEINGCYKGETDVVDKVLKGEILLLPNNLYIWATMNTSDQSLFPIDSAFKRRWDWVYIPIANVADKPWKIVVGDKTYGWWDFLEKVNEQIGATTNSEDKKLGFFFCQADNKGVIDANKFINKVLFYLWNDVFKDYGFEGELFKTSEGEILTFDKFFLAEKGTTYLTHWLDKLIGIKREDKETSNVEGNTFDEQ